MMDNLAPLFANREERLNALPEEARGVILSREKESGDTEFVDRQLSALWISKRTGLAHEEVLRNYGQLASAYFGEGASARKAYDQISALYQQTQPTDDGEEASEKPGSEADGSSAQVMSGSKVAKNVASTAMGGAAQAGYSAIGGAMSMLSAAFGVSLDRPEDNEEYVRLKYSVREQLTGESSSYSTFTSEDRSFGPLPNDALIDQSEKRMAEIRAEIAASNKAKLEAAKGTWSQTRSDNFRQAAQGFYGLSSSSMEAWGASPEFRETAVGQLIESAGTIPVMMASMAVSGPFGGASALSQLYGTEEQQRIATEGVNYNPQLASRENLAVAAPQALLEYAFGMERVLGKVLKAVPRTGGKIAFKDAAAYMAKRGLASGVEEGLTEPAQGFWGDWVASITYDEGRELFTEDALKQRLVESVTGFILGSTFGSGVTGVEVAESNRQVRSAERLLVTRDGQPYTAPEYRALRIAKTDAELIAMAGSPALGQELIAAANGDVNAQKAITNRTVAEHFVDTAGVSVDGLTLGESQGKVFVRDQQGNHIVVDQNDPKQQQWLNEFQSQVVAEKQRQANNQAVAKMGDATIDELAKRFGQDLRVERGETYQTLGQQIESGLITAEEAKDAARAAGLGDLALDEIFIQGASKLEANPDTGSLRMLAQMVAGESPKVAIEEVAEGWKKLAVEQGALDPMELRALREQWHRDNNEEDVVTANKVTPERADTEWFSARVIEYAVAGKHTDLTGKWWQWIRRLGDKLKEFITGAKKMRAMMEAGTLDPRLEGWFKAALGMGTDGQYVSPARAKRQAELEAVFSQLPTDAVMRIREAEQALADFEKLKSDYRQQELSAARRMDEAYAAGMMDRMRALDFERAKAEEAMDKALDLPANLKLSAQAQSALDEWETFSLARVSPSPRRAVPADASNVVELPDGAKLVGPTTFSITAHHGTPHRVRKFSLFKIGTGEGHQAYGWGLYFAENKKVALEYQKNLSGDATKAPPVRELFGEELKPGSPEYHAATLVATMGRTLASVRKEVSGWIKDAKSGEDVEHYKAVLRTLERAQKKSDFKERPDPGYLYTVELLAERDDFLDWDAPIDQQSEKVQRIIRDELKRIGGGASSGERFYKELVFEIKNTSGASGEGVAEKAASERMLALGIPGIRYLDGGSRSQGEGSSNYVIFDDKLVRILEENGRKVEGDQTFSLTSKQALDYAKTGLSPEKRQELQAGWEAIRAKQLASFPYPYHKLASTRTQVKRSGDGMRVSLTAQGALPISQRLAELTGKGRRAIELVAPFRRYMQTKNRLANLYATQLKPLLTGLQQMEDVDLVRFKAAASNSDVAMRSQVLAKYGLEQAWRQYEVVRDDMRNRMLAAGLDVGDIGEYFPRWVVDLDGYRDAIGKATAVGPLEKALIEAANSHGARTGKTMTNEEINAVINGFVRGVQYGVKGGAKPANTKARVVTTIAPEMLGFYADPIHALDRWLGQGTEAIARYEFFGKNAAPDVENPSLIDTNVSIGNLVAEAIAKHGLSPKAQVELREMTEAVFGSFGQMNPFLRVVKDIQYVMLLGKITSAIRQVPDLMVSMYEAGPANTAKALGEAIYRNVGELPGVANVEKLRQKAKQKTATDDWVTLEKAGTERTMAQFEDPSFLSGMVNQVFKASGLHYVDGLGKETLMNAKHRQLVTQAKRGKLSQANLAMINGLFGVEAGAEVIAQFKAGKVTEDTLFTVYNVLADWQPISLLEYPEAYLRHPNGRFAYMLKSYSVKMLAAYRREGWNRIVYGKTPKEKLIGVRNLTALLSMLYLAGASVDWLIDFLLNRDPQMDDVLVDNVWKLMQVNRYAIWNQRNRATDEGVYGTMQTLATTLGNFKQVLTDAGAPPVTLIERPWQDISEAMKAYQKDEEWSVIESKTLGSVPIFGEWIYWHGPGGQKKIERRRQLREKEEEQDN